MSFRSACVIGLALTLGIPVSVQAIDTKPAIKSTPRRQRIMDLAKEIQALLHEKKFAEAEVKLNEFANEYQAASGEEDERFLSILNSLTKVQLELDRTEDALRTAQRIRRIVDRMNGADHWKSRDAVAMVRNIEAYRKLDAGQRRQLKVAAEQFAQAIEHYKQQQTDAALALVEKGAPVIGQLVGKENRDYIAIQNLRGELYRGQGNNELAEKTLLEVLTLRERIQGRDHPEFLICLENLGDLYRDAGEDAKAEPVLREAVAIRRRGGQINDLQFVASLEGLANLYRDHGYFDRAQPLYLEALEIVATLHDKRHATYQGLLEDLGRLYEIRRRQLVEEKKYDEAVALLGELSKRYAASFGESNQRYLQLLDARIVLELDRNDLDAALALAQRKKQIYERIHGSEYWTAREASNQIATLLAYKSLTPEQRDKLRASEVELRKISQDSAADSAQTMERLTDLAEQVRAITGENNALLFRIEEERARRLAETDREQGLKLLRDLAERRIAWQGRNHPEVAQVLAMQADELLALERREEAETVLNDAMDIAEITTADDTNWYAQAVDQSADLAYRKGQLERAAELYERSLTVWERLHGSDSDAFRKSANRLAEIYQESGDTDKAKATRARIGSEAGKSADAP